MQDSSTRVDTKLVKARGEHWVCSVLAGLGWSVALTRDGLERTDILCAHTSGARMLEVQVKAASHGSSSWPMNTKAQQPARSDREWFVFVALAEEPWAANRGFVVPRDHAAAAAWIQHMQWLNDPAATPGTRNAPVERSRVPSSVFAGYENRWDLLTAPATKAPVLLPAAFRGFALDAARAGLPPGHPWSAALPAW